MTSMYTYVALMQPALGYMKLISPTKLSYMYMYMYTYSYVATHTSPMRYLREPQGILVSPLSTALLR